MCIYAVCCSVYWLLVVVVEHQGSGGSTRARVSGAWVLARGPPESVHRVSGTSAGGGEGGECGECEGLRIYGRCGGGGVVPYVMEAAESRERSGRGLAEGPALTSQLGVR